MRLSVYREDYGYNLEIDACFDITQATSVVLECKPYHGGSMKSITCSQASTTEVTATVTQDFFDRVGLWECQILATFSGSERRGEKFQIDVEENN